MEREDVSVREPIGRDDGQNGMSTTFNREMAIRRPFIICRLFRFSFSISSLRVFQILLSALHCISRYTAFVYSGSSLL